MLCDFVRIAPMFYTAKKMRAKFYIFALYAQLFGSDLVESSARGFKNAFVEPMKAAFETSRSK